MGVQRVKPKRGEVWWVNFDPSIGSEIRKLRPAVVVSANIANTHLDHFQVIPVTSNISRVYPAECLVEIKGKLCKAMADQLTTADVARTAKKMSVLKKEEFSEVEKIIKIQLGLE